MKEDKNSRQKIGQERRWRVEDGKDTGREWKIRRGGVGSLEFHDRRTMSAMQVCPSMHRVCMGGTMVGLCCPGQRSTIHANKNEMTKEITINAKRVSAHTARYRVCKKDTILYIILWTAMATGPLDPARSSGAKTLF